MVQWLKCHTSTAGGTGLIPGQGIKIPTSSAAKKKKKKKMKENFFLNWIKMYQLLKIIEKKSNPNLGLWTNSQKYISAPIIILYSKL